MLHGKEGYEEFCTSLTVPEFTLRFRNYFLIVYYKLGSWETEKRNYPLILRGSASEIDANEQTAAQGSLHFPCCTNFVHSQGTLQVPSCVIRIREGEKKDIIHSHFSWCHFFVADLTEIKQAFSLILVLLRTNHNLFLIMEYQHNWWQPCCDHILRRWLL